MRWSMVPRWGSRALSLSMLPNMLPRISAHTACSTLQQQFIRHCRCVRQNAQSRLGNAAEHVTALQV